MAVSFTLLVLLLSVTVDGGRIFLSYIAVRDAAEEGALHGSLNPTDSAGIESRVRTNSTTPVNLAVTGTVTVSSQLLGAACAGNGIKVTVTHTINLTMPFISTILGNSTIPLTAVSTATILRPPC
ncbi:MAG: TadE/TadG family type IV pilus assembly protein [Chloroflexi bacterium]|nr:TadE/TadG family type IV pilus assembly protein [Chloroflexota bacterium]